MTQAQLAGGLAISQPYLAQLEAGKRTGDVTLHARVAEALRLRIEDLVPGNSASP